MAYFGFTRDVSAVANKDLIIGDETFPAGASLSSEFKMKIKLLDPDRRYLNFDCVTIWQFNLNIEKKAFEAIRGPITSTIINLELAKRFCNEGQRRWLELEATLLPRKTISSARQIITENVKRIS